MIRYALSAALVLSVAAGAVAGAQSTPGITRPIKAARRVADKMSANIEAQQNTDATPQSPAPAPGARKPAAPRPATGAPQARGQAPAGPAKPTLAIADTARGTRSTSVAERGGINEVTFRREVYGYEASGRRDPFVSLLASGELRPILSDLRLVAVAYDPTGRNSVAVMRDASTNDQYRVKVGQTLGRMRVAQIQPKSVTFTIEEFGYSRREELALGDSSTVRTK
jgi:hypothetical protein